MNVMNGNNNLKVLAHVYKRWARGTGRAYYTGKLPDGTQVYVFPVKDSEKQRPDMTICVDARKPD